LILIDERKGRAVARERGLRVRGTLGVLVEARRAGHLVSLRSALDELRAQGFRVASTLIAEALQQVGEE
jgi:predicted nucleic acid-binding protein